MNAQPRPLSTVQADQMVAELEAADRRRLDDLSTKTADLVDLAHHLADLDDTVGGAAQGT